ncbi:MAG TPA: archaellin/type IV pilin N-terminal domain-containing protein [Thermoplasmata archaeon]|nr:archaellin/type IV pilin N-terminal domain-containing protein [Thermoplasmata archaeon]
MQPREGGPRRWRHRQRHRAVAPIIATILLVGLTVAAGVVVWMFRIKPPSPPPAVFYTAQGGLTYPVWGDPTDCRPVMPQPTSYYTSGGTSNPNWPTYSTAWWAQCHNSQTGTYNMMNVSEISITKVSQPTLLSSVEFEFICHNSTPTPITTTFVAGSLAAMSWFPGSSQSIPSNAPTINSCATFNASNFGGGSFSTYYNRLGFYEPLTLGATLLQPGDAFILYVHTRDSVLEAPSPIEHSNTWNQPDVDDYHGAPPWCFSNAGACTIYLLDTATSPQTVLATIPVTSLA